jgi:hypothetical protein
MLIKGKRKRKKNGMMAEGVIIDEENEPIVYEEEYTVDEETGEMVCILRPSY